MSSNLKAYITERYGDLGIENPSYKYAAWLCDHGYKTYETPYGFFIAKAKGDAFIVRDLYTTKEARKKGFAWSLFYDIRQLAKQAGSNVILGFSNEGGYGQEHGRKAMEAAGFVPYAKTETTTAYIRGAY